MTGHEFTSREDIVGHLRFVHGWTNERAVDHDHGFHFPVSRSEIRLGSGEWLQPDSELLAVHRELHNAKPDFVLTFPEQKKRW